MSFNMINKEREKANLPTTQRTSALIDKAIIGERQWFNKCPEVRDDEKMEAKRSFLFVLPACRRLGVCFELREPSD
jgi:hypothetical protein